MPEMHMKSFGHGKLDEGTLMALLNCPSSSMSLEERLNKDFPIKLKKVKKVKKVKKSTRKKRNRLKKRSTKKSDLA